MLAGFLTFTDRPKADTGASIAQLERLGVQVKIITVDNGLVAAAVCAQIGVDCAGVSASPTRRGRHGRPPHLRQHHEVRADGDFLQLREHVQRGRRRCSCRCCRRRSSSTTCSTTPASW
jgi:magnesium-transporting ATPase (P-type)